MPAEIAVDHLEIVSCITGIGGVFIGDTGNAYIGKFEAADRAVEIGAAIESMQCIVIEMCVCRYADIDSSLREIMKVPVPFTGGDIAPRVDHDGDAGR